LNMVIFLSFKVMIVAVRLRNNTGCIAFRYSS